MRRVLTLSVFEEAAYIRHVNSSSLLISDLLAVHDCPSSMNTSINSSFFLNSFSGATFPRPEKAFRITTRKGVVPDQSLCQLLLIF